MIGNNLDKILDFIQEHLKYENRDLLREYVEEHEKYGTIDYALDTNGNVVAFCRWNVSEDGKVADILDFAIHKKHRNNNIGSDFIVRALKNFNNVKNIRFQRGRRSEEWLALGRDITSCQRSRELNIEGILRHKIL